MAKFSDRLGITQTPNELQVDTINDELRNSLWNWILENLQYDGAEESVRLVWKDYFKEPLNKLSHNYQTRVSLVHEYFVKSEWFEAYNFVEFIFQSIVLKIQRPNNFKAIEDKLNHILERELAGYRMINTELVPITDKHEVESVRQAMSEPSSLGLEGVSRHITKALSLLGKKPEPDYANSIKESISAVESICKLLTGEKSGGIDKALAKISAQTSIHPALKQALSNLYGYTSDESGIRHAILETKDIGFAEAKFMLVACTAFVNFVVEKARRAKLF